MANISASLVKELRERTNAGMMECKKALVETEGNIEQAIELLRKKGQAKAEKKSGRTTAEGLVATAMSEDGKKASIIEVNCETDFVAREERFIDFVVKLAELALANNVADIEALSNLSFNNSQTVEEKRLELINQIGENITLRRISIVKAKDGIVASYVHGGSGSAKIAVLTTLSTNDPDVARDVSMHVAAMKPEYISEKDIPKDRIEKEKEILLEQAKEQHAGKPADILEKIISGKLNKFLQEMTLLGQSFVKDQEQTVGKYLESKNAVVESIVRYEVGEGIEKKVDNFVEEVMSQAKSQAKG